MKYTVLTNSAVESVKANERGRALLKVDAPKRTKEGAMLKCAGPRGALPPLSPEPRPT